MGRRRIINVEEIREAEHRLRALLMRSSRIVLEAMHEHGGPVTVNELVCLIDDDTIAQPRASQALAILRKHGFVYRRRYGKYVSYWLDYDEIKRTERIAMKIARVPYMAKSNELA